MPSVTPDPARQAESVAVLSLLERASTAYGRPDLAQMVRAMTDAFGRPEATVAVVGGYQTGKSSLVNAILGTEASPVVHGSSTTAPVRVAFGPDSDVTADAVVRVEVPSPLLADGLVLLDLPGNTGPLGAPSPSLVSLPVVDAVVVTTRITQELTSDDVALVEAVRASGRPVLVVATCADLQPRWCQLLERSIAHLEAAGIDVPMVAVSSPLRQMAMDTADDGLDEESGMPPVIDWLLDTVVASVADHRVRAVTDTGGTVLDALESRFATERAALVDADRGEGAAQVAALRDRVRDVEQEAARWSAQLTTLLDQAAADVEADLRRCGLAVLTDAESRIDEGDPALEWPEFERWLDERLTAAMTEHLDNCHRTLVEVVDRSSESFDEVVGIARPDLPLPTPSAADGPTFRPTKVKMRTAVYGALRNSYGGLAMLGFFGSLAGLVITTPIAVGIGLVLSGKQLKDERAKQLVQRRAQAKSAVRSYVDQAWSTFGNRSRVQQRAQQRTVRAELSAAMDRLRLDVRSALDAASAAASADEATRRKRLVDIDAELQRLAGVRARVDLLAGSLTIGAGQ